MRSSDYTQRGVGIVLALALACAGCIEDHYRVEMRPTENGLERTLYLARIETDKAPVALTYLGDDKDRLERVYGVRPDSRAPYVVKGVFQEIPVDIGNWGSYDHYRSLLGSSGEYVERFGGTSLSAILSEPLERADSLVALVRIWFAAELGQQPHWSRLESYLDEELHAQLREYASAGLLDELQDSPISLTSMLGFEHPDLIDQFRLWELEDEEDASPGSFDSLRSRLVHILELTTPAESARALAFLADREHALASVVKAVGAARNLSPDEAQSLWTETYYEAYDANFTTGGDSLQVRLELGSLAAVLNTNGVWDTLSGLVEWRAPFSHPLKGENALPAQCFAAWSVPDSVLQHRLFGRVLLDKERLFSYARIFASLDSTQQAKWDRMLLALKPGNLKPLEKFRLSEKQASRIPDGDLRIIRAALAELILLGAQGPAM